MALEKGAFGIYFPAGGDDVRASLTEAQALARREGRVITIEHNDTMVQVAADSNLDLLHRDWMRGQAGCLGAFGVCVSAYPSPELSADEMASDLAIKEAKAYLEQLQGAAYVRYHRQHEG